MTCSMPPPPVLTTTAARSRCSGDIDPKSMPDRSTASVAAATPKWMNRLIRRAILRSIVSSGSKFLTSAAIFTSWPVVSNDVIGPPPGTPASRFDQYVSASLPMGVIAPQPVTTARRDGSELGTPCTSTGFADPEAAGFYGRALASADCRLRCPQNDAHPQITGR